VATAFSYRATDTFCYNVAKALFAKQGRESVNTIWILDAYLPMYPGFDYLAGHFLPGPSGMRAHVPYRGEELLREIEDDALEPIQSS
jgi:hypothetical protein